MKFLNAESYLSRLNDEVRVIEPPVAPARRIGVVDHIESSLLLIRRNIGAIAEHPSTDDLDYGVYLAMETASYLFAAGAPTTQWRHWTSLAGLGFMLLKRYATACPFLVLGGERAALEAMQSVSAGRCSPSATALWQIAVAPGNPGDLPDRDDFDCAWRDLVDAVPARDYDRVEKALNEVSSFWMLEGEGDWELFHPGYAPDFEPEVCAVAAIAVRGGYRPRSMDIDVLRFLEPGLADGFPEPLFPSWRPAAFGGA